MVTSSKILTVTYGTFSCTLEGFDDPFTTLQKVAEYFRKLAAEDRYFGGTPQTPDTETLRRIAEANSPKPINAEVGEHGITLRQSADIAQAPAVPFDVGHVESDLPDEDADTGADLTMDDSGNEAAPPVFFRSRRPEHDTDVAVEVSPEPLVDDETEAETEADEISRVVAGIAAAAGTSASIRAAAPAKDVELTLAAIRQNVEQAESEIEATSHLQAETDDDDVAPDAVGEDEQIEPEPAEIEAGFEVTTEDRPEPQPEPVAEAETHEPQVSEAETELPVEPVAMADEPIEVEAEAPTVSPEDVVEAEADPVPAEAIEAGAPEVETQLVAEADEIPDQAADHAAAIKPEALPEPEAVAEPEATVEPETVVEPAPASSLSEEDEADLARQLAAAMDQDEPIATEAPDETQWRAERRRRATALRQMAAPTNGDGALDRLLHTAQTQMEHPEQQRRVNALDQLKAAVAATEADAELRRKKPNLVAAQDSDDADEMESFRRDFRQVQSHAGLSRLSGGGEARPASPLILVSEQRIDEPDVGYGDETPMREVAESHGNLALKPRIVADTAQDDDDEIQGIPSDAFSGATSFEDFVERVGVFEMTELLEAAAAYTSIVEGEDRFSRASVMSKIAMLNHGDGYSKEAGLRAFGKLLREGKILRVQDGQFAVSKASRYSVASRYES